MSNAKELRNARRKVNDALDTLAAIEALPRRKGSLVVWHNGVVWRRAGDDAWEPLHANEAWEPNREVYGLFPSAHVATSSGSFAPVQRLKKLPVVSPVRGESK